MPPDPPSPPAPLPPILSTILPGENAPVHVQVNTQLYYSFAKVAESVAHDLAKALLTCGQALEGTEGMAGDDNDIARPWTTNYDGVAKTMFERGYKLVEAWFAFAYRIHQAGVNHEMTEYNAGGGKGQAPAPPPAPSVTNIQLAAPPSAYKAGPPWLSGGPAGVVDEILKQIVSPVHNANPAALRSAGDAWKQLVTASVGATALGMFQGTVEFDQISPEFNGLVGALASFHETANKLATACATFGDQVQEARDSIRSALMWLGIGEFATTAVGIALTVFTAGGSDGVAAALDSGEGAAATARITQVVGEANGAIKAVEVAEGSTAIEDAGLMSRLATSIEAPVAQVEAIGAEGVDATGTAVGRAGWSARKAEAWEKYEAKTQAGKTKGWSEERWSKSYDSNKIAQNAKQGKDYDTEVRSRPDYSEENGWTGKEHSDGKTTERRWDDFNEKSDTYAEFKSGRLDNGQLPHDAQKLDEGANMQYEMRDPSPSDVAKLEQMAKDHPNGDVILNGQVLPKG